MKILSVCIITYNHEKYLKDTLDGILMQKVSFDYEIVVGEDCSTDSSRKILIEYSEKYPNKFKLLLQNRILGAMGNYINTMEACTGKYVALCEGDDYWTDPYKLQKQVDFLEANNDFVMCFTNTMIKVEETGAESIAKKNIWDVAETKEILQHNSLEGIKHGEEINSPGHTSSVVYRNHLIKKLPDWFSDCFIGDEPLYLILSKYGKAKFINDFCSVYRQTSSGISTKDFSFERDYLGRIFIYKKINLYFDRKYEKDINNLLSRYYFKLAKLYFNRKKYIKGLQSLNNSFYYDLGEITRKFTSKFFANKL